MRKFSICSSIIAAAIFFFNIIAAAARYDPPTFSNIGSTENLYVTPDNVYEAHIYIACTNPYNGPDDVNVQNASLTLDCGALVLMEGSDSITNFELRKVYTFKFYVPEDYTGKSFIRYHLSYGYEDSGGSIIPEQESYYMTVNPMSQATAADKTIPLSFDNIDFPANTVKGTTAELSFGLVNKNLFDLNDAEYSFYYGSTLLKSGYIGVLDAKKTNTFGFNFAFDRSGKPKYKVVVTYTDDKGVVSSLEKEFTVTVEEEKPLEISNVVLPDEVIEKTLTELSFNLVNKNALPFSNAHAYLYKDEKPIADAYIGTVPAMAATTASLSCKFDNDDGDTYVLEVVYTDNSGEELTAEEIIMVKSVLEAGETGVLKIQSLYVPHEQLINTLCEIKLTVTNPSKAAIKGAEIFLYDANGKELDSVYISEIAANSSEEYLLDFLSPSKVGTDTYKVSVKYFDNAENKTLDRSFSLNSVDEIVEEAEKGTGVLKIQSVYVPREQLVNTLCEVKLTVTNPSKAAIKGAEVFLYDSNGKELDSVYISEIADNSSQEYQLEFLSPSKVGKGTYKISIKYFDNAENKTLDRSFSLNMVDEISEETEKGAGLLKIQSIHTPREQLVNTQAGITFTVTNPGETAIKGAEAFLYDGTGKELDSVYISEVAANTSVEYPLSFYSPSVKGVGVYKLIVKYFDAVKNNEIVKSFSVNTVEELAEEGGGEAEKAANLKIQKINAFASVYTNVNSQIPVTIVNAGKGTAYNVEIYVLDGEGNETAREFVGNIPASASGEVSFGLRYDEAGEYSGTLYVTYENADESISEVSKTFFQQAVEYRISISDITGYEYVMTDSPVNIEFSVLNGGSINMLNATAYLSDAEGNSYGECYIGNIEPGVKKERQKFSKVALYIPGQIELTITLTYENEEMQSFTRLSAPFTAEVQEMYVPDYEETPGDIYDPDIPVDGEAEQGGIAGWIIWCAAGGGAVLLAAATATVVKLRRRRTKKVADDEDLDYFYEEMRKKSVSEKEQQENK